jgi:hypothetical protein
MISGRRTVVRFVLSFKFRLTDFNDVDRRVKRGLFPTALARILPVRPRKPRKPAAPRFTYNQIH